MLERDQIPLSLHPGLSINECSLLPISAVSFPRILFVAPKTTKYIGIAGSVKNGERLAKCCTDERQEQRCGNIVRITYRLVSQVILVGVLKSLESTGLVTSFVLPDTDEAVHQS